MPLRDPLPDHQNVAIIGLGEAGRAAAELLHHFGKNLIACDRRADVDPHALPHGTTIRTASHDITGATAVVLSPGANPEWPENRDSTFYASIRDAIQSRSHEVLSEVELAARALPVPLLTIGGTDGKSTTAALANHLLNATGRHAILGGNSWRALSAVVAQNPDATRIVAEISAFQLWEPHGLHPRAAILTNIEPDHLDHYGTEQAYIAAKRHILRNLGNADTFVPYTRDVRIAPLAAEAERRGVQVAGFSNQKPPTRLTRGAWVEDDRFVVVLDGTTWQIPTSAMPLPGPHNLRNAMAALLGALALLEPQDRPGPDQLEAALRTFSGLPHRVELVRERRGVRYWDDSKATNVHAAVTGIRSIPGTLVAIVGGVDKGLDLDPLIDALGRSTRATLVIGAIAERFCSEAADKLPCVERVLTMDDAVTRASQLAQPGDSVLLCPACSSFDMFRGFEHRGDVFQDAVRALEP